MIKCDSVTGDIGQRDSNTCGDRASIAVVNGWLETKVDLVKGGTKPRR